MFALADECDECRAKPGSPTLCADCLRRRDGATGSDKRTPYEAPAIEHSAPLTARDLATVYAAPPLVVTVASLVDFLIDPTGFAAAHAALAIAASYKPPPRHRSARERRAERREIRRRLAARRG